MPLALRDGSPTEWRVRRIGVVGPGIVGMPMAAMLAHARIRIGEESPAVVTVVQRESTTSGWKVGAINEGRSPIGGVEPELDRLVAEAHEAGLLRATHDYGELADADVVLVAVQTDRKGDAPDYGPLMEALTALATALRRKPAGNVPVVIIESTLAPSSMATVVRAHFARHGLHDGRDLLLGNSPNRVMPGRLVERVRTSDKIVAGLHPATAGLIRQLYSHIVTEGTLHPTNSLTAEVVKVLENAYRDVRIAYAAEVARDCDERDVDFYAVRDQVNERIAQTDRASSDPSAVPTGGLLVPTVGVGGHCLPKDGVLLWWRALEAGVDSSHSLILGARRINDESPAALLALAERKFGALGGATVALLGVAYRADSEDTRNSPTLRLARLLSTHGCRVLLHDPYVAPHDHNLVASGFAGSFSRELAPTLADAEYVFICAGHAVYARELGEIVRMAPKLKGVVDGFHVVPHGATELAGAPVAGIGRGREVPSPTFVDAVERGFRVMECGVANELAAIVDFLNARYADRAADRVQVGEVRRLAGTCITGCAIVEPGPAPRPDERAGLTSRLVHHALRVARPRKSGAVKIRDEGEAVRG
jgi:UDP-N-acetyl-D-mannosaminuronic acid dehydrogenase